MALGVFACVVAVAAAVGQADPGPLPAAPALEAPPDVARPLCRALGAIAWPIFEPLTLGAYDSTAWSRDRRQCSAVLLYASMAGAAAAVNAAGHPRRPAVFGSGRVDRFFRDALRSRSRTDNVFAGDLGGLWAPLFATAALTLAGTPSATPSARGRLARAIPLLWLGLGGNELLTAAFKKGFGRERPYLALHNAHALQEFGAGDDARESFYSGHASTAFLTAAFADPVLADLLRTRWPRYRLWSAREHSPDTRPTWRMRALRLGQGLAMYGLASAVGHSRIEIDQHFMTDVLAGALVGGVHGHLLYRWGYDTGEDRNPAVAALPGGRGIRLTWRF